MEIAFKDIQPGDLIRVSFPPRGGMSENWDITHSRTAYAFYLHDMSWLTPSGQELVNRMAHTHAVIELLERLPPEEEDGTVET
jgi:hypothetical protein